MCGHYTNISGYYTAFTIVFMTDWLIRQMYWTEFCLYVTRLSIATLIHVIKQMPAMHRNTKLADSVQHVATHAVILRLAIACETRLSI